MTKLIENAGNAAGILGLLTCLVAGAGRAAGYFHLAGYEAMTLFTAGMGLMVAACLAKVHVVSVRR